MDLASVVGIYGISGAGKSRALSVLSKARPEWRCLEGRVLIEQVLEGVGENMQDFSSKEEPAKEEIRNQAIRKIQDWRGMTVVAGHCSFPVEEENNNPVSFSNVITEGDRATYSAILYLDKNTEDIHYHRTKDNESGKRSRSVLSVDDIDKWIKHEKALLEQECEKHGIYFALISDDDILEDYICEFILSPLVSKAQKESEANLLKAIRAIPPVDVFLLIDGDRTLSPVDTGTVFFDDVDEKGTRDPLKTIFKRYPAYTFQAFLEVAMLYERTKSYKSRSIRVGKMTAAKLYDEWVTFLSNLPLHRNVHPILVTSGNREVWETAIESIFVGDDRRSKIDIIGGNHLGLHEYIVDANAKAKVVRELRNLHGGCKIISFGDSVIDVPMLQASDRGYIVIDDRRNRSMRSFISTGSISNHNTNLYQLLFSLSQSDNSSNGNDNDVFLHDGIKVGSLVSLLNELSCTTSTADGSTTTSTGTSIHNVRDYSATNVSASILATQTRRSDLSGPALQDVHVDVGRYLAERLLDDIVYSPYNYAEAAPSSLVREGTYTHVQQGRTFHGVTTTGINNVLILPLMRGGEPMARGVYKMFPDAKFVHYNDDMDTAFLQEIVTHHNDDDCSVPIITDIMIVDSVINEGNSVRRVIHQLYSSILNNNNNHPDDKDKDDADDGNSSSILPHPSNIRIYVITGVMQKRASVALPIEFPRVRFITLRVSDNKYKGQGGTDTGNRLFGTY